MAMTEPVVAVVNNEPAYVHCLSDRNRILEVFKDAISKPLPTPSIAVSTMQEAMHPQVGFLHAPCTYIFLELYRRGSSRMQQGDIKDLGIFGFAAPICML
jgi:hypothetical protein